MIWKLRQMQFHFALRMKIDGGELTEKFVGFKSWNFCNFGIDKFNVSRLEFVDFLFVFLHDRKAENSFNLTRLIAKIYEDTCRILKFDSNFERDEYFLISLISFFVLVYNGKVKKSDNEINYHC